MTTEQLVEARIDAMVILCDAANACRDEESAINRARPFGYVSGEWMLYRAYGHVCASATKGN
jgi:hypothetical protein